MIAVIHTDGVDPGLVSRLAGEGRLPALAELEASGRSVELQTPAGEFPAAAFPTLQRGTDPGEHGIAYPFQWSAAEQRVRFGPPAAGPPPVWERLAAAGRRCLVVDPYEAPPPPTSSGSVHLSGVGFSERVVMPRRSAPRAAVRGCGHGPWATEVFGPPAPRRLLALRERLLAAPCRVAACAERMLAERSFDLAWIGLSAGHIAGHQFWDFSQIDGEALPPQARVALAGALEEVYEAQDAALARIVEALGEGADLIVVSPLGMAANNSRADLMAGMLEAALAERPVDEGGGEELWRLRASIPSGLRRTVAELIPDRLALDLAARLETRGIDFARAAAFAVPSDSQGYVRLNLRGRERDGIVDPSEAEELLERIATGVESFHDPDGRPAVEGVSRPQELYPGPASGRLPDLGVRWPQRPANGIDRVVSDRLGEVRRHGRGSGRSGNHPPGQAWALLRPGGARHREPARAPRLADVAATVDELAGLGPASPGGEPLLER